MELVPAFRRRRNERNTKTASPIAEKVGEAGSLIVLVRPELRIGEHADGHEEEPVSQPLIGSGQGKMREIGSGSERTIVPHGSTYREEADCEQCAGRHDLALDQLRCDRG